jgi:hypothetical protein
MWFVHTCLDRGYFSPAREGFLKAQQIAVREE